MNFDQGMKVISVWFSQMEFGNLGYNMRIPGLDVQWKWAIYATKGPKGEERGTNKKGGQGDREWSGKGAFMSNEVWLIEYKM